LQSVIPWTNVIQQTKNVIINFCCFSLKQWKNVCLEETLTAVRCVVINSCLLVSPLLLGAVTFFSGAILREPAASFNHCTTNCSTQFYYYCYYYFVRLLIWSTLQLKVLCSLVNALAVYLKAGACSLYNICF